MMQQSKSNQSIKNRNSPMKNLLLTKNSESEDSEISVLQNKMRQSFQSLKTKDSSSQNSAMFESKKHDIDERIAMLTKQIE